MSTSLSTFRLAAPRTVDEAIETCRSHPRSRFVAGGTDLLVNMRRGIECPDLLIDLSGIDELISIQVNEDGIIVGAGVTIAELAANDAVVARYPAVAQAAAAIAGPGHRNAATVGGNLCLDTRCIYYNQSEWWRSANDFCLKSRGDICHVAPQGERCHAAFCGDLAPALLALGAEIDISAPRGTRRIPLNQLYIEDGKSHLALAGGEMITAVRLPPAPPPSAYAKIRTRAAIDFPLAGAAVALAMSGNRVSTIQVALTGTNSRPFLLGDTSALSGRPIDEKLLQEVDRLVQRQVQPMRTTIASANYRRVAAASLARRLIATLGAGGKA